MIIMMAYWRWNNMMNGWDGFGLFNFIIMLAFWILLIYVVVALVRYFSRTGNGNQEETAITILKERYAKGELKKKEFEEMTKDIKRI